MKQEVRLAPPNSLILVMDQAAGEPPKSMGDTVVAATSSCVAVGTLCEHDGETTITLSDQPPLARPGLSPVFDGELATPGGGLSVCSVVRDSIMSHSVASAITRIRILTNDESEPDQIYILVVQDEC